MTNDTTPPISTSPLTSEQQALLSELFKSATDQQLSWISGYLSAWLTWLAKNNAKQETNSLSTAIKPTDVGSISNPQASAAAVLTVLYGSATGKGEKLAQQIETQAQKRGLKVKLQSMSDFSIRNLHSIENLLVVVSTHGNGAPALAAKELHSHIFSKKAPRLDKLNYAVLALGDTSYPEFCKAGLDFDLQLEQLGAKRIQEPHLGDIDVEETAPLWIQETLAAFNLASSHAPAETIAQIQAIESSSSDKTKPHSAAVLEKIQLHGRGSDRQTIHLELDTTNSALQFQPGDSAGIVPINAAELIREVLQATGFEGLDLVRYKERERPLQEYLSDSVELSKITPDVVKRYQAFNQSEAFQSLANDKKRLKTYLEGRDIADLMCDYPCPTLKPEEFLTMLRPLQPRLYSISSSPLEFPDEVHLTIGVVSFEKNGRNRKGTCSTYLSDVKVDDEHVSVFIEPNPNFRLPLDPSTPIVMIGAGTGVAPYRAFLQHRSHADNPGKSWLFFGNRNFENEFLYQTEWQRFLKEGILTRMDVAFSRDGTEKKYVQHRLYEQAAELHQWIQNGAHLYVCGDRVGMAGDVQQTLIQIIAENSPCSTEEAQAFLDELQLKGRYQLDVY